MRVRGMRPSALHLSLSLAVLVAVQPVPSGAQPPSEDRRILAQPLNLKLEQLKWARLLPELGERSPRIATLRVDPRTKATSAMIRLPANFHLPLHWHPTSESHLLVKGDLVIECNGVRASLERGDYNYVPAKIPHEVWAGKDGALYYISLDGPLDLHWVHGPPTRRDFIGEKRRSVEKPGEED